MNQIQTKQYMMLVEFDRICRKHDLNYQLSSGTLLGAIRHQGFIPWDDDIDVHMDRHDYEIFLDVAKDELDSAYFLQTNKTETEYYHGFAKIRDDSLIMKEQSSRHLDINHGVWIDVLPLDRIPKDKTKRNIMNKKTLRYNKLMSLFVFTFVTPHDKWPLRIIKSIIRFFNERLVKHTKIPQYIYDKREFWSTYGKDEEYEDLSLFSFNQYDGALEDCLVKKEELENSIEHCFESQNFKIPAQFDTILRRLYDDYMQLPPKELRISNHYIIDENNKAIENRKIS